jgi:multiple sugar transport system substrate-binding protein
MKKVAVLLIAIGIIVVLGLPSVSQAQQPKLGIVVYKDNPNQHIPTTELVNRWAKENNVQADITIGGHSNRLTINTTALEGGTGPDILMLADFEPNLFSKGLLDLSDLADKIGNQNGGWYPIAKEIGTADGQWKALPIYIYMHEMIYRKDILQAVGAKVPQTWDEFRTVLKKIKNSKLKIQPFGVAYGRSFDGQQFLISVILSNGGQVLSNDGKKVVFNSPETVKGLKYVIGLYRDGLVDPTVPGWDDSTNNQAMLAGRIAFTFNSFSIKMQAEKDFPELNPKIGVAVYPAGPKGRFSFPFTLSYGIRKNSTQPELAKKLLAYLFEPKNYQYVLEYTSGATGVSLKGFANLPFWAKKPDWKANLDAIPTAHLFAPPSAATAEVNNSYVIVDMIGDVLVRGMTEEKAVEKAAKQMEGIYFGKK